MSWETLRLLKTMYALQMEGGIMRMSEYNKGNRTRIRWLIKHKYMNTDQRGEQVWLSEAGKQAANWQNLLASKLSPASP